MFISARLQLNYDGQRSFNFNRIDPAVADEYLYDLAEAMNSLQEEEMTRVIKIERRMLF